MPAIVFALMVSVGMSLRPEEVVANWRRIGLLQWGRMLLATFVAPPAFALLIATLFGFERGELVGLFLIGVVPGAPLVTRNAAKRGFDLHTAAAYQIWCALLVPVMVPLTVFCAGQLYHRDIWIEPVALLRQIAVQQFLPLLLGIGLMALFPAFSSRAAIWLGRVGSLLLLLVIAIFVWRLWPQLREVGLPVLAGALLLAAFALGAMLLLGRGVTREVPTLAICNANRHVGLALLMAGQYLHIKTALPAVAAYAIAAPFVMAAYAMVARPKAAQPA